MKKLISKLSIFEKAFILLILIGISYRWLEHNLDFTDSYKTTIPFENVECIEKIGFLSDSISCWKIKQD